MQPIRSIADIPFRRRPALELLHLTTDRDQPDPDYTGFGHARLPRLTLEDGAGRRRDLDDALLLALHSCDLGAPRPDDVELEFFVDEVAPDYSVTALLSSFLAARLAPLSAGARAVVLALCNPHLATLAQPPAAGATPVWYALGDVESWLDPAAGTVILRAPAWRLAGASP
ncbi:MAG TPA: hypothetical protein VFU21_25665 [Kofleriaceae bacterium]|nr:hypothetical protein [Kofleriaceae bacterium]